MKEEGNRGGIKERFIPVIWRPHGPLI